MFYYREVSEHEVGELKREMVKELMAHVCPELGIEQPTLKWFVEADLSSATFKDGHNLLGSAGRNNEILLRADQDVAQLGETAMHELQHCLQFKQYPDRHDFDELVAHEFGVKGRNHHVVQRYVNLARNRANSYSRIALSGRG